jgi:hypothetical protein
MPIEPFQLESGLLENDYVNFDDNEVMVKPALCIPAPSKLTKNRLLIFCAVVSAAVGLIHVFGFSAGSTTRFESNSNSLSDAGRMDEAFESFNPGVDEIENESFNPGLEAEKMLCNLAQQTLTDGIINIGQIATTPNKNLDAVPACFENDHLGSWYSSWYWMRRPRSGLFTLNFDEVFKPANNTAAFDIHVSAYEGDCGEVLECVGTQGVENDRHGSTTWTTIKGKTYLLRVQHMPGIKFDVPVITDDSRV